MKRNILPGIILVLCIPFAASSQQTWAVSLQKDYTKSYPVNNETIALLNRFGQMNIETWDKNEVKVDAKISVSAQNKEYATRMLDRINITDEKKTDRIEFKTELGDQSGNWSDDNGGHEMHIDWTVHVPADARLQAENQFGSLSIGDYRGEASLLCKYGTLKAGKLSNCREIVSEFGKAIIENISDSKLLFRYSRIDIAHLSGNIQGEMQFCGSVDLPLDNNLKQLDLKNNYTSLYLLMPADFSADYDIGTSNAKFSSKNNIVLKEENKEENTSMMRRVYTSNHHYTGSIGKGGGAKLMIKSNSGNIRLL